MTTKIISSNIELLLNEPSAGTAAGTTYMEQPGDLDGEVTMPRAGLPPPSPDEQIRIDLLNLARKAPDSLELDLVLKEIRKQTGVSIRVLREQYDGQKHKIELGNTPPPTEPTPEELTAAAAAREAKEEHQREVESAAETLATSSDIFAEFERDFRKSGYIADRNLSRSLLISHGARLLPDSTAFMLVGASGSGKSDAIVKASAFLPPEFIRVITSASQQSFYYLGDVRNQYLMFGEMHPVKDDTDDYRQTAIRQLVSENRLTRLTVEKANGRTNSAAEKVTEGPCVLIASTTTEQGAWSDEFANRTSWLRSNDSEGTTIMVLELQSAAAQEPWNSNNQATLTEPWHAFHQTLRPLNVIIPFAKLCMPRSRHVTVRRLFNLLFMYTKVSALLHQRTREIVHRNGRDFVVAIEQDYRVAYELLTDNAPRVLEPCSGPAMAALNKLRSKFVPTGDSSSQLRSEYMTTGQIQQALREPNSTVRRWLLELTNAGLLSVHSTSGRQNVYTLGADINSRQELGLVPTEEVSFWSAF